MKFLELINRYKIYLIVATILFVILRIFSVYFIPVLVSNLSDFGSTLSFFILLLFVIMTGLLLEYFQKSENAGKIIIYCLFMGVYIAILSQIILFIIFLISGIDSSVSLIDLIPIFYEFFYSFMLSFPGFLFGSLLVYSIRKKPLMSYRWWMLLGIVSTIVFTLLHFILLRTILL